MTSENAAPAEMPGDVADRLAAESAPHSIAHVICDELRSRAATIIELSSANKALESSLAELRKQMLSDEGQHREVVAAERERCAAKVTATRGAHA